MTKRVFILIAAVMLVVLSVRAADTNAAPDFKEVSELIRAHLPGATDAELNRAALDGVWSDFKGRVVLAGETKSAATNAALVSKTSLLDDSVGYVRIASVAAGLGQDVSVAIQQLAVSNKLKGLVLDLRFADGDDYAAAAATAELFSRSKKDAARLPVAVLVNGATSGAAEALAAAVRQSGAGLILGGQTAGRAALMREFPLKNGQRLLIASAPVKLADGSVLTTADVKPDIAVAVKAEDERAYFADAYANLTKTNLSASSTLSLTNQPGGTNRPARKRMSEADLVRKHRDGLDEDEDAPLPARPVEPEPPVLRDPVLVRAVDLLKGLALVRQSRAE